MDSYRPASGGFVRMTSMPAEQYCGEALMEGWMKADTWGFRLAISPFDSGLEGILQRRLEAPETLP